MTLEWIKGKPPIDDGYDGLIPGMVVKLVGGQCLLVGHVNDRGGACDCCTMAYNEYIVEYSITLVEFVKQHAVAPA